MRDPRITHACLFCNARQGSAQMMALGGSLTPSRLERALCDRRIFLEHRCRPNRPRRKIAAAIWAAAIQARLNAIATEGAFECADHRIVSVGRQIFVAAFAAGLQQQHASLRLAPGMRLENALRRERLIQIGDEIGFVFDADRQPHDVRPSARGDLLLVEQLPVRRRGRMNH